MAIGEDNILEGLDLSVLDRITTSPEAEEKQLEVAGEEPKIEEDPGIFNPELKIQEIEELPEKEEERIETDQVVDQDKQKEKVVDTGKAIVATLKKLYLKEWGLRKLKGRAAAAPSTAPVGNDQIMFCAKAL